MTRSTNMEHVEVLRDLSEVCRAAIKAGDWKVDGACDPDSLLRHADAAIASLSAPQPPAEAQPVAHYCEHRHKCKWHADGAWPSFGTGEGREQAWKDAHAERCGGRILPLYAHPPPSAPVGVEDESVRVGNLPTMNQDGYPGLGEWWVQLWRGDEIIARVYGDGPDEVRSQAQDIADALNQQPAAVDGANPYPAPRNRQEAASLARLALAYLGVTSAHIDAVVARCETDLAAQQGG